MKTQQRSTAASVLGLGTVLLLGLSACGDGGSDGGDDQDSDQATAEETMEDSGGEDATETDSDDMESEGSDSEGSDSEGSDSEGSDSDSAESGEMDPAADLVGSQCEDYAEEVPDGDGSVEGMAEDPVATAASNNPMLTTLTDAVSGELNPDVDLVDTLNGDEFTVLAPTDDAFAEVPEEDLEALTGDADQLTDVLTYHVIPGQLSPDEVAGEHETVQGDTVMIEGEGEDLMFDEAGLVCGGVMTSNATVYMIDGVLMPDEGSTEE